MATTIQTHTHKKGEAGEEKLSSLPGSSGRWTNPGLPGFPLFPCNPGCPGVPGRPRAPLGPANPNMSGEGKGKSVQLVSFVISTQESQSLGGPLTLTSPQEPLQEPFYCLNPQGCPLRKNVYPQMLPGYALFPLAHGPYKSVPWLSLASLHTWESRSSWWAWWTVWPRNYTRQGDPYKWQRVSIWWTRQIRWALLAFSFTPIPLDGPTKFFPPSSWESMQKNPGIRSSWELPLMQLLIGKSTPSIQVPECHLLNHQCPVGRHLPIHLPMQ